MVHTWDRATLNMLYPFIQGFMRRVMRLHTAGAQDDKLGIINSLLDDVDAAIAANGGKFILGACAGHNSKVVWFPPPSATLGSSPELGRLLTPAHRHDLGGFSWWMHRGRDHVRRPDVLHLAGTNSTGRRIRPRHRRENGLGKQPVCVPWPGSKPRPLASTSAGFPGQRVATSSGEARSTNLQGISLGQTVALAPPSPPCTRSHEPKRKMLMSPRQTMRRTTSADSAAISTDSAASSPHAVMKQHP